MGIRLNTKNTIKILILVFATLPFKLMNGDLSFSVC